MRNFRRTSLVWALAIAIAASASACGDTDGSTTDATPEPAGSELPAEAEPEPTTTTTPAAPTTLPPPTLDERIGAIAEATGFAVPDTGDSSPRLTSASMGGVSFLVDERYVSLVQQDTTVVLLDEPGDGSTPSVSVQLVTQTAAGTPITTLDEFFEPLFAIDAASVIPTGTAVNALGHDLEGHDIVADDDGLVVFTHATDRSPSAPSGPFSLLPSSTVFVAETPSGILSVGLDGPDSPYREEAEKAFTLMVASLEFTGPGLDPALPAGPPIQWPIASAPARVATPEPSGPEVLTGAFSPIDPGTYQLTNFGDLFSLDVGESWWVQVNDAGFIALTSKGSAGPGDRDVVFIQQLDQLVGFVDGSLAGESLDIDDVDSFLANAPDLLEISDVVRDDVGGRPATRFDVEIRSDAECSEGAGCQYAFLTHTGNSKYLEPSALHRIWWFDEHAAGPAIAVAMADRSRDWLPTAQELMDTIDFIGDPG